MTSAWKRGGGGGGVSKKLTKVDIGGCVVPYKVDINHDALKGWGKEKPKQEKLISFPWTEILTK